VATLTALGWTGDRDDDRRRIEASGLIVGRVALEHNHVYRVLTAEGERLAESAGRLKFRAEERHVLPVVGDWVVLRVDEAGSRCQIREVLPRATWLSRRAAGSRKGAGRETEEQVLAANLARVFVVFGLDKPVNLGGIERYLSLVRSGGIDPVLVLNKSDLLDASEALADATSVAAGTPVIAVTTKTPDGCSALEPFVGVGVTVALIGPSGVGKSSIVNRLIGHELLATGEVRDWDQRGRHTSVHRQLVVRERGGVIIDTPGMREIALWDGERLTDAFPDIVAFAAGCRFRDCRHETEPGCAVKSAVERGELEGRRYESYVKLQQEQEAMDEKREERAYLKPEGRRETKTRRELRTFNKSKPDRLA
jgi:ribosome biogenesis GTPase